MLSITVPGNRAQMKKNSLVICKCLPVVGGNLRNCISYNYFVDDFSDGAVKKNLSSGETDSIPGPGSVHLPQNN